MSSLEAQTGIDRERSITAGRGDSPEAGGIDVQRGIGKVRMIQDIDCIDPQFKLLDLVDRDSLDEIHIQANRGWPGDPSQAEISDRARSWVDEKQPALRIRNCPVAE